MYPSTDADINNYQLRIIYSNDSEAFRAISRTADAYYIDDIKEILRDSSGSDYLSGRVEWGAAIRQTFGFSARKLLQTSDILGESIESAAKIYSTPGGSVPLKSRRFGPEVSGRAFVDLAYKQLPELAGSKDAMELAVERPYDDACLHFEKAMAILKEMCGCSMNCYSQAAAAAFIDLTDQVSNNQSDNSISDSGRCLRLLVLPAIQLVRQISNVASMPANLCLNRRGLETLYEELRTKFSARRDSPRVDIALLNAPNSVSLLNLTVMIFDVELPFAYVAFS